MKVWETFGHEYLVSKGREPEPTLREDLRMMSLEDAAQFMKERYMLDHAPEIIVAEIEDQVARAYDHDVTPKPGVPEMLEHMYKAEIPLCVASVTTRYHLEAALRRTDLLKYFVELHSVAEVGRSKDYPDIYLHALNTLQTPLESTWVFEDAIHAVQTARRAGFPVVGIADDSAAAGFEVLSQEATIAVRSFEDFDLSMLLKAPNKRSEG